MDDLVRTVRGLGIEGCEELCAVDGERVALGGADEVVRRVGGVERR